MLSNTTVKNLHRSPSARFGTSTPIAKFANRNPNPDILGGTVGSTSVFPTGFAVVAAINLTTTFVQRGTDQNGAFVDIRISGAPNATSTYVLAFHATTAFAALQNQIWEGIARIKLAAGAKTNVGALAFNIQERTAADAAITDASGTSITTALNTSEPTTTSLVRTLSSATCAFVRHRLTMGVTSGQTVDITLRIYANLMWRQI